MLKWNQIQAVADKLAGQERMMVRPGDLDEPWRTLYRRLEPVDDPAMRERALWKATAGMEDRNALVEEVVVALLGTSGVERHRSLGKLADDLEPVRWLWPGWIPRGMLSLLGAAPGAGKSLLALDLARRVIHAQAFPGLALDGLDQDGRRSPGTTPEPVPRPPEGWSPPRLPSGRFPSGRAHHSFAPGNVVYVDAEAVPQIQNERALAWGMDRSRLYLMLPAETYGMIDFGAESEQQRLLTLVYDLQPELVVVDSLSSISVRGENSVEDVRAMLSFLAAVAREFDLALLLIHHLRKRAPLAALRAPAPIGPDDFRGSTHIIAIARSVLALSIVQEGPEPDRNGPRRLEVIKTNLCRYPPPLGVRFVEDGGGSRQEEPEGARDGDPARAVPRVVYGPAPKAYRKPTQTEACAAWLLKTLQEAGAPLQPKKVLALAQEQGFTRTTLYRARRELAGVVVHTAPNRSPDNLWALAGEE
jgi:hypothetical protein